jgi:hypothetical protein
MAVWFILYGTWKSKTLEVPFRRIRMTRSHRCSSWVVLVAAGLLLPHLGFGVSWGWVDVFGPSTISQGQTVTITEHLHTTFGSAT